MSWVKGEGACSKSGLLEHPENFGFFVSPKPNETPLKGVETGKWHCLLPLVEAHSGHRVWNG